MKKTLAIAGFGKVGSAFGTFLDLFGYELIGYSRTDVSGEESICRVSNNPWEITKDADIVFITTPDGVIQEVTEKISEKKGFKKGAFVFHASGAQPSTILKSAKDCGAFVASLHPLQSIASREFTENPFKGSVFAVEGDDKAVAEAERITEILGGISFRIKTESKKLYHAAAVVASNYLVTLIDFSMALLETSGIEREKCFSVIEPLILGTLKNIKEKGTEKALTGPVQRGDEKTVMEHIETISEQRNDLLDLYKILGSHTLQIAEKTLDKSSVTKLKEIFK